MSQISKGRRTRCSLYFIDRRLAIYHNSLI